MPLTAAEVRGTKFSTTRMRAGYDMDEVDAFLDIVEADVAQYFDDLQRSRDGEAVLRTQCDQLQARLAAAEQRASDAQAELKELQAHRAHQTEPIVVPEPVAEAPVVVAPVVAAPQLDQQTAAAVAADPEASTVLAIAQQQADEIIRFAQSRADTITANLRGMLSDQLRLLDRG